MIEKELNPGMLQKVVGVNKNEQGESLTHFYLFFSFSKLFLSSFYSKDLPMAC